MCIRRNTREGSKGVLVVGRTVLDETQTVAFCSFKLSECTAVADSYVASRICIANDWSNRVCEEEIWV